MAGTLNAADCWTKAAEDAFVAFERTVAFIEQKRRAFDFPAMTRIGACVFVGEGDLSFAHALARDPKSRAPNVIATTFEAERAV